MLSAATPTMKLMKMVVTIFSSQNAEKRLLFISFQFIEP